MSLKKLNKKGFTLIELMIVVAIIGILAAIAVPKFADMVTKSKEASTKGSLGAVRSAVSIYYGDMEGEFPNNLYTSLTDNDKYMSSHQGLGNFSVPKNGNGNPGHSSNTTRANNVVQVGAGGGASDAAGVLYFNAGPRAGEVFVNCMHTDTKGSLWTAY